MIDDEYSAALVKVKEFTSTAIWWLWNWRNDNGNQTTVLNERPDLKGLNSLHSYKRYGFGWCW